MTEDTHPAEAKHPLIEYVPQFARRILHIGCGRGALARMTAAYEQCRRDGLLPATHEVVYGQAWRPAGEPRGRSTGGEVVVPISQIGRRRPGS